MHTKSPTLIEMGNVQLLLVVQFVMLSSIVYSPNRTVKGSFLMTSGTCQWLAKCKKDLEAGI